MTILLLKITFVVFVLCMDVLIIRWCLDVSMSDAILLMLIVGTGCMVFVGFAAGMMIFLKDILCA